MFLKISFFIENGCILCLTKDEDKFRRWQICSLEVVRAVSQFEDSTVLKENEHSEFQEKSFQEKFVKHLSSLTIEFNQLGNPF